MPFALDEEPHGSRYQRAEPALSVLLPIETGFQCASPVRRSDGVSRRRPPGGEPAAEEEQSGRLGNFRQLRPAESVPREDKTVRIRGRKTEDALRLSGLDHSYGTTGLEHAIAVDLREIFSKRRSFPQAFPPAPNVQCRLALQRSHRRRPASSVAQALLPKPSHRQSQEPAWSAWSERVARNPLRLAGMRRSKPNPRACVPAGRKPPRRLYGPLQESNASCPPRSHSRNVRNKCARDLQPRLRGSDR